MKTTDVVLWKRNRVDREGMVSIREINNGKRSYKSLGIRLETRLWDDTNQRVKRTDIVDYKALNEQIANKLKELDAVNKLEDIASSNSDFIVYADRFVKGITSVGSQTKYRTVVKKFKTFLKQHKQQQSLRFDDINPELIRDLHNYLLKSIEKNTANHYMKLYSQILNRAIEERKHQYIVHPFISTKYTRAVKSRKVLNDDDIRRFRKVVVDQPRLQRAQNAFIFQLLAQGMRVSDMILLRWSNIDVDGYINYKMFKTSKEMSVKINGKMWDILITQANDIPSFKTYAPLVKSRRETRVAGVDAVNSLNQQGIFPKHVDLLTLETFPTNEYVKEYVDSKKYLAIESIAAIKYLTKTKYANEFIFPFLKISDFPKGVDSLSITPDQYKAMHSTKIVYNRHLKELQKLAKINIPITSHLARHAYTQLLITDKGEYDVYDISKALGHSSLKVTESYLGTFSKDHIGKINDAISKRLD